MLYALLCTSLFLFLSAIFPRRYCTRDEENFQSRMGAIGMRTRCVNCCTRTKAHIVILICVKELCTTFPLVRLMISTVTFFYSLHLFEMIGSFSTLG